eukprot:scaffold843_cov330-Pavlova_lutheri.AAC.11
MEVDVFSIPTSINQRFVCRCKRVSRERSLASRIVPRRIVERSSTDASRHTSGHFGWQLLEGFFFMRKLFRIQLPYAALAIQDPFPHVRHANTQWRHQSKACHHHSPAHERRWITESTPNQSMHRFPTLLVSTCHLADGQAEARWSHVWSSDTATGESSLGSTDQHGWMDGWMGEVEQKHSG